MPLSTSFLALIVCTLAVLVQRTYAENSLARGFNDDINWVTLEDGLKIAKKENKPLMILIHKSWCQACQALKPLLTASTTIVEESEHFVMVNTEIDCFPISQDDEEPAHSQYSPDGEYIPRVFFLSPDGTVVKELFNGHGNPSYKYWYYYPSAELRFNDDINWVTLEDGLEIAKKENKPLMILIHKSWCGACKALKPQMTSSTIIVEESEHFVMVNTEDDEEPGDSQYSPDGGYIPRVFFLNPDGAVVKDLFNEQGSPSYKYYYPSSEALETGMKRARGYFEKADVKHEDEL